MGICVLGLFIMGPIAFIWCCSLHSRLRELEEQKKYTNRNNNFTDSYKSRIRELEEQKERLESMLQSQISLSAKKTDDLSITKTIENTGTTETVKTTETAKSILTATQIAKERANKQYPPEIDDAAMITDSALRTELQWAKAIPLKNATKNETPSDSQIPNQEFVPIPTPIQSPTPPPLPLTATESVTIPTESVTTAATAIVDATTDSPAFTPLPVKKPRTDEEWEKTNSVTYSKEDSIVWQSVELWIGRKLLGWVAVLGFIVSAALFIRHAVQSGWIGPELKVCGIAVFGAAFLGAGKYFWNNGWQRFSTMLSSAGIIILFQAGYASFAFYKLISVSTAGVLMPFIIFGSFLLAWHYTSKLLGIISILGGLAVPLLLSEGTDRYAELFTYLIILNIGTIILVNLLQRSPIGFLAFFGTQIEFWMWYLQYYSPVHSVPPEKLAAVLIFHGLFYLVYLTDTTIAAMIPRIHALPTWDDAMRAILSPIILFGTIWQLLRNDLTFGSWLGVTAFIGAAWYGLLAVFYSRHLARIWNNDIEQKLSAYWKAAPAAATVIALGFVAIGIPLHFDAACLTLGWVTVFAGLWYFGHRQDNKTFRVMALVFITLGVVRLLYDIFEPAASTHSVSILTRLPVFSFFDLPSFAAISVSIFSTVLTHRLLATENKQSQITFNFWLGLISYGFMILFLSVELLQYFTLRPELYIPHDHWAPLLLTVLWTLLVLLLFETGVVFRSSALRNAALFAFFIVIIKMLTNFFSREYFSEPIFNPFCPVIIFSSFVLIGVAVQERRSKRLTDETVEEGVLGVAGIFLLLGVLSVECYQFFMHNPTLLPIPVETINDTIKSNATRGTLSVLWTCYALILFVLGILFQEKVLRGCGLVVFFGTLIKIASMELLHRPDYNIAFINPYFITMLVPVLTVMFTGIWTIRIKPAEDKTERDAFLYTSLSGMMLFWIFLSVECFAYFHKNPFSADPAIQLFIATASLPILWTLFGGMLIMIGTAGQSVWLRGFGLLVFAVTVAEIICLVLFRRPAFEIPLLNPCFISVFIPSAMMISVAVWMTRLYPLENQQERHIFFSFGILGTALLWTALSIECFTYFDIRTNLSNHQFLALTSLPILWTVFGGILIVIGMTCQSVWLRGFGLLVFAITVSEIICLVLFCRPAFEIPLLNPYFISIFIPSTVMIAVAVWTLRLRPLQNQRERISFLSFGISGAVLLWAALSIECFTYFDIRTDWSNHQFLAAVSLTVFWSLLAIIGAIIAGTFRSKPFRILSVGLALLTLLKVLPEELWTRPDSLTPFLNPYVFSLCLLAFVLIFIGVYLIPTLDKKDITERNIYRVIAFFGVVFLWQALSLECFKAVRLLQGAESEAWKAQMSLSILWSVFAGMLIFIGFVWRSSVLRWMAILLFAVTLTKILFVDMAGVHEIYRFGAVFVLAIFLSLAAWAYQRFKPESK
jgi:uncharacterized membrane protein